MLREWRGNGAIHDENTLQVIPCGYRFRFKICPSCGQENDVTARECSSCQATLIDADSKLKQAKLEAAKKEFEVFRTKFKTDFEKAITSSFAPDKIIKDPLKNLKLKDVVNIEELQLDQELMDQLNGKLVIEEDVKDTETEDEEPHDGGAVPFECQEQLLPLRTTRGSRA